MLNKQTQKMLTLFENEVKKNSYPSHLQVIKHRTNGTLLQMRRMKLEICCAALNHICPVPVSLCKLGGFFSSHTKDGVMSSIGFHVVQRAMQLYMDTFLLLYR